MDTLDLILLLIAAVCFALAAFNVAVRVDLIAAGLLAWALVPLVALIHAHWGS